MKKPITPIHKPGPIILFGSGETSPSGRKIFDCALRQLPASPRIALLETPAGFELNSAQVIGRVADFLRIRLQNYQPQVNVIPARKRGTSYSPDDPSIVAPLYYADMIFMGPGSPTYAVRQLQNSLAWHILMARHRLGASIALASAATVAISIYALPVYEIYKVGEELHWKPGLDLFGHYGLPLVFIPHWDNNDGGEELDTSRCFMGQSRFARLMEQLPPDLTVLGIDEKTALIMNIQTGVCHIIGLGGVTLIHTGHIHRRGSHKPDLAGTSLSEVAEQREGHIHQHRGGETFPLSECCPFKIPGAGEGLPPDIWQQALDAQREIVEQRQSQLQPETKLPDSPPDEVISLLNLRQAARSRKEWSVSDALRNRIAELGWEVVDTPDSQKLIPKKDS